MIDDGKRTIKFHVENSIKFAKNNLRKTIATVALSTALVGTSLNSAGCSFSQENVTIAKAIDLEDDEYEGVVPVLDEDEELIGTVPNEDLVIVYGKIKKGDKLVPVAVISTAGETLTGYIASEYLEELGQISEEALEEYNVIYSVDSSNGVNVRSSAEIVDDNLVSGLADGEQVLGKGEIVESEDNSTYTWVPVLYIGEDSVQEGYICSDYLIEQDDISIEEEIIMVVNTGGIDLNVRTDADVNSEKITTIENGTEISISVTAIEEMISNGGHDWVKITLEDGTEGYVAYEYLEDVENIVGIDVSSLGISDSNSLRELLTASGGAIESTIDEKDTSDIEGKINFVYIRLGASGYGTNFSQITDNNLEEFVSICEEYGVPYGFYYYSTAITKEESELEAEYIKELIESLGTLKFNELPIALDYELSNNATTDRQYGLELTEVKAYLAYLVEKEYGQTIVYGNIKSLYNNPIVNLETYSDLIDECYYNEYGVEVDTGERVVWLAYPREEVSSKTEAKYNIISESATAIMEQTLLDVYIQGVGVDVDVIGRSAFELIKSQYEEIVYKEEIENEIKINNDENELV